MALDLRFSSIKRVAEEFPCGLAVKGSHVTVKAWVTAMMGVQTLAWQLPYAEGGAKKSCLMRYLVFVFC